MKKKMRGYEAIKLDFPDDEDKVNPYYLSVAEKYRVASLLSWSLLVIYLIVMLCLCRDSITYDNLTYLIKDFDADIIGYQEAAEIINYEEEISESFCRYKGRLVYSGSSRFTMYSASGNAELENKRTMENPTLVSSDKYVLEYDLGGTEYNIYSSLAKVHSGISESVLSGAALSEDGGFALVSRSKESKYVVTVYNSAFREISKVYKDKFVMDTVFGDDGEYVIISAGIDNSAVYTEIMFCRTGSDESSSVVIPGMMPLKAGRLGESYAVICDGAVVICKDGAVSAQHGFDGRTAAYGNVSAECAAVLCSDNVLGSSGMLTVFGETGEVLYTKETDARAIGMWCGAESSVVIRSDSALRYISEERDETIECSDNVSGCVFFDDYVMICTPMCAYQAFSKDGNTKSQ